MKTKLFAVFVLFVMLMLPLAYAKEVSTNTTEQAGERPLEKMARTYTEAREQFIENRDEWQGLVEQKRECLGVNTTECAQARKEIKTEAKGFLLNSADAVLKALEKAKEKTLSSEDLTQEEIDGIVADIDAKIAEIQDAKATIDNLNQDSTPEEVKAAAKEIRDSWKEIRKTLKTISGRLVNARLGNVIEQSGRVVAKLNKLRDRLEQNGKDVSELDSIIADFDARIKSAKDNHKFAREAFREAKTSQDIEGLVKQAHEYMTKAKADLKEARMLLKEAIAEVRAQSGLRHAKTNETASGTEDGNETEAEGSQ